MKFKGFGELQKTFLGWQIDDFRKDEGEYKYLFLLPILIQILIAFMGLRLW